MRELPESQAAPIMPVTAIRGIVVAILVGQ